MDQDRLRRFFRSWYREHGRWFPWREAGTSTYGVLVAEMLLRQTQAAMATPVWEAFIHRYPDPIACVMASPDTLFDLVAPLGLGRQRVEALQAMSVALVERHRGKVPHSLDALLKLPHVGIYAAHAVVCFAFGKRVPVVDANVIRVFSRLSGLDYGRDNRRAPAVWNMAAAILPARNVRLHNYGLLDFAAQVCTPRYPHCDICPLARDCAYNLANSMQGRAS